jgi:hypothetical protein
MRIPNCYLPNIRRQKLINQRTRNLYNRKVGFVGFAKKSLFSMKDM